MMERLSIDQMISKIQNEECFHAVSDDYSFTLKIDEYVHYVCGAVHNGNQFRKELWDNCIHTAYERWYEEDPATKEMVQTHPIVIAGCDSRFEYDLNREPERAIYEDAWGKKLWHEPPPKKAIEKSLEKHNNFYRVVDALIRKIEDKFSICIVYDMHSYNWKRWDREVPTWNLGTSNVDRNRFEEDIESWRSILEKTPLPNRIKSTSKINDTFYGNGYFLKHITNTFHNTLVLATEISKVYCDELEQIMYPEVVHAVENYLKEALKTHANSFYAKHKS